MKKKQRIVKKMNMKERRGLKRRKIKRREEE